MVLSRLTMLLECLLVQLGRVRRKGTGEDIGYHRKVNTMILLSWNSSQAANLQQIRLGLCKHLTVVSWRVRTFEKAGNARNKYLPQSCIACIYFHDWSGQASPADCCLLFCCHCPQILSLGCSHPLCTIQAMLAIITKKLDML